MGYAQAVVSVFSNYFNFKGRAPRSEYWYYVLFYMMGNAATTLVDQRMFEFQSSGLLSSIFGLVTLVPGISVAVRRLHDSGRSGWFVLAPMLAVMLAVGVSMAVRSSWVGLVMLVPVALTIYLFTKPSEPGPNAYGPPVTA